MAFIETLYIFILKISLNSTSSMLREKKRKQSAKRTQAKPRAREQIRAHINLLYRMHPCLKYDVHLVSGLWDPTMELNRR